MRKRRAIGIGVAAAVLALVAAGALFVRHAMPGRMAEETSLKTAGIPPLPETVPPVVRGAGGWPAWRGANDDNASAVTGIVTDWAAGLPKAWQVDYLCQGKHSTSWSAPAVSGNRLVVPGRDDDNDLVFCLNPATGRLLWVGSYRAPAGNGYGEGARATPTSHGEAVYTFGRSGDLVSWRLLDGEMLWRRNVKDEGGEPPYWGSASSPRVVDDKVIVQAGGGALAIAYHAGTGKVAWKSMKGKGGYATATLFEWDGRREIVLFHGTGVAGLEPATGRKLWDLPWSTKHNVNAATPVSSGSTIFITSDYGSGCQAMDASASPPRIAWTNKAIASHHSDPVILAGHVYGYAGPCRRNEGEFKCVELATGREKWSTEELGVGSAVVVDGYLVCQDVGGNLFLVKPDPEGFTKVTELRGALGDIKDLARTKPIVANGKVFLRYRQLLVAYDVVKAEAAEAK
jgi:outer membrane protein assembly factor BamB